jgi:hypothetical protein
MMHETTRERIMKAIIEGVDDKTTKEMIIIECPMLHAFLLVENSQTSQNTQAPQNIVQKVLLQSTYIFDIIK